MKKNSIFILIAMALMASCSGKGKKGAEEDGAAACREGGGPACVEFCRENPANALCNITVTCGDNPVDCDDDGMINTCDSAPNDASVTTPTCGEGSCDVECDGHADVACTGDNPALTRGSVSCDNCIAIVNPGQEDSDADGFGDACDRLNCADRDGDFVCDSADNCASLFNSDQTLNRDGDSFGDACDTDRDNDGLTNSKDRCPLAAEPWLLAVNLSNPYDRYFRDYTSEQKGFFTGSSTNRSRLVGCGAPGDDDGPDFTLPGAGHIADYRFVSGTTGISFAKAGNQCLENDIKAHLAEFSEGYYRYSGTNRYPVLHEENDFTRVGTLQCDHDNDFVGCACDPDDNNAAVPGPIRVMPDAPVSINLTTDDIRFQTSWQTQSLWPLRNMVLLSAQSWIKFRKVQSGYTLNQDYADLRLSLRFPNTDEAREVLEETYLEFKGCRRQNNNCTWTWLANFYDLDPADAYCGPSDCILVVNWHYAFNEWIQDVATFDRYDIWITGQVPSALCGSDPTFDSCSCYNDSGCPDSHPFCVDYICAVIDNGGESYSSVNTPEEVLDTRTYLPWTVD